MALRLWQVILNFRKREPKMKYHTNKCLIWMLLSVSGLIQLTSVVANHVDGAEDSNSTTQEQVGDFLLQIPVHRLVGPHPGLLKPAKNLFFQLLGTPGSFWACLGASKSTWHRF